MIADRIPVLRTVLFAGLAAWVAACGDDGPLQARADVPDVRDAPSDSPPSPDAPGDIAADAAADAADGDAPDLAGTDLQDPDPTTDVSAEVLPDGCPAPGALLITELLPDPAAVPDQTGEYVEVHNPGAQDLDLRGLDLRSGRESHRVGSDRPVPVPARGFLLLAMSANAADNGGIVPGYVYDTVRLSNQADDVALVCGDVVIDRVSWDTASSPLTAGRSLSLDPSGFDATRNDDHGYWCRGSEAFGAGDSGTPGTDNPPCGTTSCGDRRVQKWEECDDGNALPGDGCTASCRAESFQTGSIIVTEFLVRPKGVGQTLGQWVELHNTTDAPIDIAGWTLGDEAGASARILPPGGSLVAPQGGYVVLGRSADPEANGGVAVDWAYGEKFPLGSPLDRIVVTWNDTVIDRVEYRLGTTFPEASGRSLQLDPGFLDAGWNDWGEAWCPAPDGVVLADGDRGSPGAANPPCPWPETKSPPPARSGGNDPTCSWSRIARPRGRSAPEGPAAVMGPGVGNDAGGHEMGTLQDDGRHGTPLPLGRALAVAVMLLAVLIPATLHALRQVAREQAASEEWRALAVARRVAATGTDDGAFSETVRTVGASGASTMTAAFLLTAGGADPSGDAAPARFLALGPNGMPVVLPKALSVPIREAAERARDSRKDGGEGSVCIEGGDEARLLCVVAPPGGAVAGVIAGRTDVQAPFGWPVAASLAGALLFFVVVSWRPSWRPEVVAAVAAGLAGGVGAELLAMGGRAMIAAAASAEVTLAGLLGPSAGAVPAHLPTPGIVVVAGASLAAAALSAIGMRILKPQSPRADQ